MQKISVGQHAYYLPDRLEPKLIIKLCKQYKITLKQFFTKLGHDTKGL